LPKSSTYFLPFEKLIAVKSMLAARALPKFEKVPDQCVFLYFTEDIFGCLENISQL